ncbi:MAG: thiamine diphosphokinase [Clostridiales bacterium]|nr:thiamine diphosphokinase [Clostridiales bacterium]
MEHPLCLIMLGGDAPGFRAGQALTTLLKEVTYVVAADKGATHLLEFGLFPRLVVGDSDSLSDDAREACFKSGAEFVVLPREKNFTDWEAAFLAALDAGYRRLAVFGAFGGRFDHLMGNLLLPLAHRDKWDACTFYGEGFTAYYCFGDTVLIGRPGDTVSLIALTDTIDNLTLQGFSYPLLDYQTHLGSSRCLCNELNETIGHITFDKGIVLIVHYRGQA